jgi:hypothetical protein
MGLLGDEAQVEARFGPLEIVLLLMHDWCTVCVKRTVGLEIVLEAPDGTPSSRESYGISFRSVLR